MYDVKESMGLLLSALIFKLKRGGVKSEVNQNPLYSIFFYRTKGCFIEPTRLWDPEAEGFRILIDACANLIGLEILLLKLNS